jgi:hypothetical protein
VVDVFLYLGLGKLLIYLIQKSPYIRIIKWGFLTDLLKCDLCLGVWVYFGLSLVFQQIWFIHTIVYVPVLSEFLTGCTASFVMWLFSEGWNAKFREYIIKD